MKAVKIDRRIKKTFLSWGIVVKNKPNHPEERRFIAGRYYFMPGKIHASNEGCICALFPTRASARKQIENWDSQYNTASVKRVRVSVEEL